MEYYFYNHEDSYVRTDGKGDTYLKVAGKSEKPVTFKKSILATETRLRGVKISKEQYDKESSTKK